MYIHFAVPTWLKKIAGEKLTRFLMRRKNKKQAAEIQARNTFVIVL